ncbi:MAG: alpha/beta fold hydrolase [Flammeovirgaceae bacterium]
MSFIDRAFIQQTRQIDLSNGVRLSYLDQGMSHQNCLVFIHGLGSFKGAWWELMQELQHQFRCIAIDLPGFGDSSKGLPAYELPFFVECVTQFVAQLQLTDVYLCGHSMGGQVSLAMALEKQINIKGICLLASAGIETFTLADREKLFQTFNVENYLSLSETQLRQLMELNFYHADNHFAQVLVKERLAQRDEENYHQRVEAIIQSVKSMLNHPVYQKLPELHLPTLIIYGENDQLIPNKKLHPSLSISTIMASASQQLPQAACYVLPQCGHFPQVDQLQKVSELITEFAR